MIMGFSFKPIIKGPVRNYISVGSVIMAILGLSFAGKMAISDAINVALLGAALSATLPPIEFFTSEKLCNYIQKYSDNR